jgi:hypothetical protein
VTVSVARRIALISTLSASAPIVVVGVTMMIMRVDCVP